MIIRHFSQWLDVFFLHKKHMYILDEFDEICKLKTNNKNTLLLSDSIWDFNAGRLKVAFLSPENLNEGSSKFITKDNRRRTASFKGPGLENDQTEAPQFGSWHPKHEGRRAVNDTKTLIL